MGTSASASRHKSSHICPLYIKEMAMLKGDNIVLNLSADTVDILTNAENNDQWGGSLMVLGQFLRGVDGTGEAIERLIVRLSEDAGLTEDQSYELINECISVLKTGIIFDLHMSDEHTKSSQLTAENIESLSDIDMKGDVEQFQ